LKAMGSRLYISFWDLCLDNLPRGRFERRVIGAGDASQMIRAADSVEFHLTAAL
jgi:hypothetical protein